MKTHFEKDGSVRVTAETVNPATPGDAKKGIEPTPETAAADVWHCTTLDQAEKMLPTFEAPRHQGGQISKGDASMLRDMANEHRKQRNS